MRGFLTITMSECVIQCVCCRTYTVRIIYTSVRHCLCVVLLYYTHFCQHPRKRSHPHRYKRTREALHSSYTQVGFFQAEILVSKSR